MHARARRHRWVSPGPPSGGARGGKGRKGRGSGTAAGRGAVPAGQGCSVPARRVGGEPRGKRVRVCVCESVHVRVCMGA